MLQVVETQVCKDSFLAIPWSVEIESRFRIKVFQRLYRSGDIEALSLCVTGLPVDLVQSA
jgi:hypothetical protein